MESIGTPGVLAIGLAGILISLGALVILARLVPRASG